MALTHFITSTREPAGTEPSGGFWSSAEVLDRVRSLIPSIAALGDQIEQERRLPVELVASLVEAGLFRMSVSRSLGGGEVDPITAARAIEEISAADGSTGWCVSLAYQIGGMAAYLPEHAAREVFGDADAIGAGVARPVGRAVPVEGGYRVTGRWPFASGSSHATWFGGECVIEEDDALRSGEDGKPLTYMMFFPRADVDVHDTWTALGLRGTASNDFSVSDVFVPVERSFAFHADPPVHPGALYRDKVLQFLGHGSHALGIAGSAITVLIDQIVARYGAAGAGQLREQIRLQSQIAEAQALVDSARSHLYATGQTLWDEVVERGEGSEAQRARVRLAISHAARSARQAMDLVHAAAGTSAIFAESPLDRKFRDIHTALAHVMVGSGTYEAAGRVALGLPAAMPFF
jgi:alkylation response protein AidB-like acyl-CoA dehydrogenase